VEANSSNSRQNTLMLGAGFLLACGIVFGAYNSVLNSGFLLDDFKHLGYAYNANHGDPSGLLRAFTGNWTGQTDGLTSFRPGISLSFWLDNLLFGLNAVGYHVTNLFVFTGCTLLCGLIGYQLTTDSPQRERLLAAAVAILLFATYPIHVESVSWIIGRVDVHCTFFYLSSISLYLQFRATGSLLYFPLSIGCFLASLICKEMAVTLPVVIATAEIFLAKPLGWQVISIKKKLLFVGSFFAALGAFGVLRTLLLGTVVGGYGNSSLRGFFRAFRNNFFDGATFSKILFGINEEQPFSTGIVQTAHYTWIAAVVLMLTRLLQPLSRLRVMVFLLTWLVVAELPTFQIWHIFPNLVGSRLFFLGSSAMCLLLAVTLVPSIKFIEPLARKNLKLAEKLITGAGVIVLLVLSTCWFQGLKHNLFPWIEAGRQMQNLNIKLLAEAGQVSPGKVIVLIDLPQDYSGAGMIGRPELLESMMTKPVAEADHASKFVTLTRPIPGPIEYVYPNLLATVYGDSSTQKVLHWSKEDSGYIDWRMPEGAQTMDVTEFPPAPEVKKRKTKRAGSSIAAASTSEARSTSTKVLTAVPLQNVSGVVSNPTTSVCVWLTKDLKLDPFALRALEVEIETDQLELMRNSRLVWRSQHQPKSWIDYTEGPFAEIRDGKLLFLPGRYRSWLLNGAVEDVGIQFAPGQYKAQVKRVRDVPDSVLTPGLELSCSGQTAKLQDKILPVVHSADSVRVLFDASKIAGAKRILVAVTKTDIACPDLPSVALPEDAQLALKQELHELTGEFQLPSEALAQKGKHQVVVLAMDANGKPIGFTSEPRTYFVDQAL
jgi:hypothetical protein